MRETYVIFVNSEIKKWKKYCHFQEKFLFETIENSNSEQTMQTFNQNVLNSTEIRNLNNVHYESYQNSNAIVDENEIKMYDDDEKKKENDENDDDDENEEKMKFIFEEEIDSRVWNLQNKVKKEKKEKSCQSDSDIVFLGLGLSASKAQDS